MFKAIQNNIYAKLSGIGRFSLYSMESLPIRMTRRILDRKVMRPIDFPEDHLKELLMELKSMLEQDVANLNHGIYELDVLPKYNPISHAIRYLQIYLDSIQTALRARSNKFKAFDSKYEDSLNELPEYYRRNFHFQTNGYLSSKSAELYEHQTEILFRGSLALMRRLAIAESIKKIGASPIRVLELGCGIGETTEVLLKSCPNIQISAIDLSEAYIAKAKQRLGTYTNLEFHKIAAEDDLTNMGEFDLVISSYMFHELPREIREKLIKNAYKALKKSGTLHLIDSLQWDDNPKFNWALKQFPIDFHEPFYANYIKHPLNKMLEEESFSIESTNYYFLTKSIRAKK